MEKDLKVCIKIDGDIIYKFSGKIDRVKMMSLANNIEKILLVRTFNKDKVQNVFELFIETMQNVLNYSYKGEDFSKIDGEGFCCFALAYCTETDIYTLESCNFIEKNQQKIIEEKVNVTKGLSHKELRKLVRKKSRTAEDKHEKGAGLGFIMMARGSLKPIEINFSSHKKGLLIYCQKLFI